MPLGPGTRVGPYEIVSALGAGGMGEVYRARDTRLKRDVALKILPESFASDPDRLARFQREAEVLASLNHPHIAAIYGLDESNRTRALVMELVEGETLADRIARGAIPVDEALPIARQIAEALEVAHEHGIIHRDLKPANIKVTPDGVIKVLDFGLAKALEPAGAATGAATISPTITSPALMTGVGLLLGTAAYMSPEQARGKVADKRSDIWAFGCVLFEMLTGKRTFDGEDTAVVLASVIKSEPDWAALPTDVPVAVVTVLRGCLEKERRSRVADISAATFVFDHAAQLVERTELLVPASQNSTALRPSLWRRIVPVAGAAAIAALITGAGAWLLTRPVSPSVVRMMIPTSGSTALAAQGTDRDLVITPDGSRVVYRSSDRLLVRTLSQLEPAVLSVTGGVAPRGVFISPDGQWVGFFSGNDVLKKVAITGGPPVTITSVDGGSPRGATWGPDGTIVFATGAQGTGLQRVSAAGGNPTVLTKPDREHGEGDHFWPEFLPGGRAILFTIVPPNGTIENAQIAVLDLETLKSKVLIQGGSHAYYLPTGHLVYGVVGTLRAVAFDVGKLEVTGTPTPVLEGVVTTISGAADAAVSSNGSLAYVPGSASVGDRQTIVSVDRQGHVSPLPGIPLNSYRDVRVSPDGTRFALATLDDVWIYDLARATLSRLTTDPAMDARPLWTPDGRRIVFRSNRAGYPELFWRPADGTGVDERLLARGKDLLDLRGEGWSPDGKQLLFTEVQQNIQCAIGQTAIDRTSDVKMLVQSEFCNDLPAISPDGRWVAYQSNVSGRQEIYVERYPELGYRQQISTGGGRLVIWSRDARELFFSTADNRQMFVVPVQSGATLAAGRPKLLFDFATIGQQGGNHPFDLTADGRFVMVKAGETDASGPASNMVLVLNWFEELKRLVPAK